MRSLLFFSTLLFLLPSMAGTKHESVTARIVEFGVYYTRVTDTVDAPTTTSGELSLLSEPMHVRTTSAIPALARSSFGLRYRLEGIPEDVVVEVTDVVATPGLRKPESSEPLVYREVRKDLVRGGDTVFTGYTFDESWEAVPGNWTIELWAGDRKLLAKEFTVLPAKPLRH